jgi:hypothetical protein
VHEICLVLPVLEGRADDARAFLRELEDQRKEEYARSEERIGITRELWWLAQLPAGPVLVASMRTEDFERALGLFSQSDEDFDVWFKRRLAEVTGIDLNDPPEMSLPELLSHYEAAPAAMA